MHVYNITTLGQAAVPAQSFDWSQLLSLVPLPVILTFISASLIPEISAFFTSKPNGATGLITVVLSIIGGIVSNLAMPHADWKVAVGTAIVTWFLSTKWHTKILSGSEIEAILHESGPIKGKIPVARGHGATFTPDGTLSVPGTLEVGVTDPPNGSAARLPKPPITNK